LKELLSTPSLGQTRFLCATALNNTLTNAKAAYGKIKGT
jgi:hypothetical protein